MKDFYQHNYNVYHEKTFCIDPSSFLDPFVKYLPPDARIMDVGCGGGRDLCWLQKRGFRVMGFERADGLAKLARKNAACQIIEGDFEIYDFSALQMDAIILIGAIVHVPHSRFENVLRNIVCCLRDGGKLLVSLKQGEGSSVGEDGRNFYYWQDTELRDIFARLDFEILDFHTDVSKVSNRDTWLSYVLMR